MSPLLKLVIYQFFVERYTSGYSVPRVCSKSSKNILYMNTIFVNMDLNYDELNKINYELLALFDDNSVLSHIENCNLDLSYFNFLDDFQTTEVDHRNEESSVKQSYSKTDSNEKNYVFAVPEMYNCMYCFKRFYSRSASRRHQVYHAKQQLKCSYCKMRSYSVSALRRHFEYFHPCTRRRQILIETR
ncbi:uncharacterized protein LOC143264468 [Megachile rotundata]|uniref:uncharacterized protein LOC143264468 n=1 Tax=Megachile rotundata TaxID=143995 RepID=UPI003FD2DEFB